MLLLALLLVLLPVATLQPGRWRTLPCSAPSGGILTAPLPRAHPAAEEYDAVHGQQAAAPKPQYRLATQLVHPKSSVTDPYSATAPPLYQTATFSQPGATSFGPFDYTRSGNPTRCAGGRGGRAGAAGGSPTPAARASAPPEQQLLPSGPSQNSSCCRVGPASGP
jgi:hypothetical protein